MNTIIYTSVKFFSAVLLSVLFLICGCKSDSSPTKATGKLLAWGKDIKGQCTNSGLFNSFTNSASPVPGQDWYAHAAGGRCHTLALKLDGTVWASGCNMNGQLGDGTLDERGRLIRVEGVYGATSVSCGEYHSLALTSDGKLWGWGHNSMGQLGDATRHTQRLKPVSAYGLDDIVMVDAGDNHTLALSKDGSVYAFGENLHGQLGTGDRKNRTAPFKIPGIPPASAVAAGGDRSYVLTEDGILYYFGKRQGIDDTGHARDRLVPESAEFPFKVKKIAAGRRYSLLIGEDGEVRKLEINGLPSYEKIEGLPSARDAAAGSEHVLVLDEDKSVWAFGRNMEWQLGVDRKISMDIFRVPGLSNITAVGAGWHHSLAVKNAEPMTIEAKSLSATINKGKTLSGKLPVSPANGAAGMSYEIVSGPRSGKADISENRFTFSPDPKFTGEDSFTWRASRKGKSSNPATVYIRVKEPAPPGSVWVWGNNYNGELGDGTRIDRESPIRVSGLSDIVKVTAGSMHSLALKNDGTVWLWGRYDLGKWTSRIDHPRPSPVDAGSFSCSRAPLQGAVDIYSSRNGSLVVRKDGSLWGWGALPSRWGEDPAGIKGVKNAAKVLSEDLVLLKDGTVRAVGLHPRAASARMDGMKDIADVSFGYNINMVLKKDGRLFSWKLDSYSENVWKPNGDNDEFMLPLDDIVEISAGADHALARDKAGNVWTWGDNDFGQLGDGTTAESEVPLKVKGLKKVAEVSAGPFFSLALREDGKVFSWGQNNNGQLGDRTNKNRKTPVKVHILHNVKHISAGRAHCLAIVE